MRKARLRVSMSIDLDTVAEPNIVRSLIMRGLVTGLRVKPHRFYDELVGELPNRIKERQDLISTSTTLPVVVHKPRITKIVEQQVRQEGVP